MARYELALPTGDVITFPDIDSAVQFKADTDLEEGASPGVRAFVGSAPTADARLQAIKEIDPKAVQLSSGGWLIKDPVTKRRTLLNPPGFQMGDIASVGREAATLAGGTAGAFAGEYARIKIGQALGLNADLSEAEIMTEAAKSAGLAGAGSCMNTVISASSDAFDAR